jgi:hypothetical protein
MGLSLMLLVVVAVVLLAGFVLPKHAYVARRVLVDAPVDLVWPDVGTLATWPEWTDWNKENDPGYDPKPDGTNKLSWSTSQAGPGEQLITESDPAKGIKYRLELQGGKFRVDGRLSFKADGTRTYVTWVDSMDVAHSYLGRYMGAGMDEVLGPRIEKSLLALKRRSEDRAKQRGVVAVPAPQLPDPALTPPPAEPTRPTEEAKVPPIGSAPPVEKAPPAEKAPPVEPVPQPSPVEPKAPAAEPPAAPPEKAPAVTPEPPAPEPPQEQPSPSD